jgi:hypothetical protein
VCESSRAHFQYYFSVYFLLKHLQIAGAARDTNGFWAAMQSTRRPTPDAIVYDGVFNETYIKNSVTGELLDCFPHLGIDRKGKLFVGLEVYFMLFVFCILLSDFHCSKKVVSELDGKPRGPTPLDLVVCIDVSGSMQSGLGSTDHCSKLDAAKKFALELIQCMRDTDRIAIVTFSDTAKG